MKKLFVALVVAGSLVSVEAMAQGRAGTAAVGAVSGAVVLGPVGAVAGAVIGFTAGPSIVRSWGIGRSETQGKARRATQASLGTQTPATQAPATQGPGPQASGTQQQAAAKITSPPPVKTSETLPAKHAAPPVQGFD